MEQGNITPPRPADPNSITDQFTAFVDVVKILRKECPWDRKQTNESISQLLIEETYEMIDAIEKGEDQEFAKELGDILLHIVMHSVMAEERGAFNINDVMTKEREKMVFRHPHVFSDVDVDGEKDVLRNWENLKLKEGYKSILQGVPKMLPALLRAQRMQFKASKAGFDWPDKEGVWDKIEEELRELRHELSTGNNKNAAEELGDLIFAIVNAARHEDIEAEKMLQVTNDKFKARFEYIEKMAAEQGRFLSDMTLEEMDELWDEAKAKEKK